MVRRHPYPPILDQIPRDKNAVIEASAGTGKTFTLEHLIVDRVLSGVPIDRILVVTFTEKATAELRRRVRSKLTEVRTSTLDRAEGPAWEIDAEAEGRLSLAERRFHQASISTIHGFCQRALTEHAFLSRRLFKESIVDPRHHFQEAFSSVVRQELAKDPELVPLLEAWLTEGRELSDLERLLFGVWRKPDVGPVLSEEGLASAIRGLPLETLELVAAELPATGSRTRLSPRDALREVSSALADVRENGRSFELHERLMAGHGPLPVLLGMEGRRLLARSERSKALIPALEALEGSVEPLEVFMVHALLPRVEARAAELKRARGLVDFDDLLHLLDEALREPERGETLAAALRARHQVALIDEFQDTDAVQWSIFRRLYLGRERSERLYVIGDPKQAIYGFRGADVHTYFQAKQEIEAAGGNTVHLVECHRSTKALIDAYNHLMLNTNMGPLFSGPNAYDHPVVASPNAPRFTKPDGQDAAPICLVLSAERDLPLAELRTRLARWMVAEIRRLTDPEAPYRLDGAPVRLSDIFILTHSENDGRDAGDVLMAAGVPHRFFRQEGLFQTREARAWFDVLAAVLEPSDPARRNRAFLSPIFGLDLARVRRLGEPSFAHPLIRRLYAWRELMEGREYGRLFSRILADSGVLRRELILGRGDRARTNHVQLAELLMEEVGRRKPSPEELVVELGRLIEGEELPRGGNVQRVGAADDAVQIMTIHKSKGLEATVVFLFGGFWSPSPNPPFTYRDEGRRKVDVRRLEALDPKTRQAFEAEALEDNERISYVALTRAKGRLYIPHRQNIKGNGRHRLIELRAASMAGKPAPHAEPRLLEAPLRPGLHLVEAPIVTPEELASDRQKEASTAFEKLRRGHAGRTWTSYSRMKAEQSGARADGRTNDDRVAEVEAALLESLPEDELLPGAKTGVLVHEVLERVPLLPALTEERAEDWAARPEVRAVLEEAAWVHDLEKRRIPALARMTHRAFASPLEIGAAGPLAGLVRAERVVRELEFLFPIKSKSAMVIGFTDVVFEHEKKAYFLDWKTDLLPDYGPEALAAHIDSGYRLQVKLYSLALMRLLHLTSEEEAEAKFGGVLYVFLRGLAGEGSGQWFLRPSYADLVTWSAELEHGQAGVLPIQTRTSTPPAPMQFRFPFAPEDPTEPRKRRKKR
ncbi:MAG: UvrD-helicase domain-containing protein [Myxococcota bacterium]